MVAELNNEKASQLKNLQNRLFGKRKEWNILDTYHYLMINYGYIPFEEFKKMPAELVDELVNRLNKMAEEFKRSKKGGK